MKMFSVRDLSSTFKQPTYDILFDDKSNGCVRCSFSFYTTLEAAQHEVDNLLLSRSTPTEWDKVLTRR
jgi:hypothetical protein